MGLNYWLSQKMCQNAPSLAKNWFAFENKTSLPHLPSPPPRPGLFFKAHVLPIRDYRGSLTFINEVYKSLEWETLFLREPAKEEASPTHPSPPSHSCTPILSPWNLSIILPSAHYQKQVISTHLRRAGGRPSELFGNFWVMSPWHTQILKINYQTSMKCSESFASKYTCL